MEATSKLYSKLANVKSELKSVIKNSDNPFFKSKYADLNSHIDVVEPLMEKNKLLLLQPVVSTERGNAVYTKIVDTETGEMIVSSMNLVGEVDMQKAGSAVTYARRYTLAALLAMKAEDDDAESSMGRTSSNPSTTKKKASFPRSTNKSTKKEIDF